MDNNIEFITSIKLETDFEELVRQFVQKIFSADAFLVGGPYDGGKDIVYSVRGKEQKEAMQISIQEGSLESKLKADLEKVVKLVDNNNYPSLLHFFWSHTISESRNDQLKTMARKEYGITLEFYDAKKMAQKISREYPEILQYLLEVIHSYTPSINSDLDIKERALYEYLALSKDTANLKNVIIESSIVSSLYGKPMPESVLHQNAMDLNLSAGKAKSLIANLEKAGRILIENGLANLTAPEINRINNIEKKESVRRNEVIENIRKILEKYTSENIAEKVLQLIKKAYAASIEIQISEINFEPPRLVLVKNAAKEIELLLKSDGMVAVQDITVATRELITHAADNEYLSDYCSSRLCISLLNQRKLERYIDKKRFFVYLDAPVLIRYIYLLRFPDVVDLDGAFKATGALKDCLRSLKRKEIRSTLEHFEETVRHLEKAERISKFASDQLIADLGDSKNVFFNGYLKRKSNRPSGYNFDSFLDELIGFNSPSINSRQRFEALLQYCQKFLEFNNVRISGSYNVEDELVQGSMRKLFTTTGKNRKFQTVKNDLVACEVLSDDHNHLDENGVGQVPFLVTWDTTQHEIRTIYREKCRPFAEWFIYSPQRAIERLSMIDLKISSASLKDGVMAIIDEDFFKDSKNSLVDTLAIFLGDNPIETGEVTSLLTKLTKEITDEGSDPRHTEFDSYNVLNEVLMFTYYDFKADLPQVLKLFSLDKFQGSLFELLKRTSMKAFDESAKRIYEVELRQMILLSEA